ncbi:MAG: ankyrin repeat domain-containing protein, partial [Desulfobacterales bacterium]|nr:ankyrin repeat domain-containing protein [Desulfobacterales bacterium]
MDIWKWLKFGLNLATLYKTVYISPLEKTQALSEREELNLIAEESTEKTSLSYACLNGHMEIAEYLLKIIRERLGKEKMIKVLNKRDKDGQTSLLLAAWKGHVQVVSVLLAFKETDVNMPQKTGMTSLHLA